MNAAIEFLLGGGGVAAAIHKTTGLKLLKECQTLNVCPTGEAKITGGYQLPSKYVIHTVGPVWFGGYSGEANLLASCYRNSLAIAKNNKLKIIAFPCVSTGAYGYPFTEACKIAWKKILDFLEDPRNKLKVILVTHAQKDFDLYNSILENL